MAGTKSGRAAADALCATCADLVGMDGAAVSVIYDGMSSGTYGSSSETSRRLDEYQFTFGEGPCLDAVATRSPVLVPDMNSRQEDRWPAFRGAALDDGVRGVFALPIMITSVCVGALDLFRAQPGPLHGEALAGAKLAAELASAPLIDLIAEAQTLADSNQVSFTASEAEDESTTDMDRIEVFQASGMLISALGVTADEALVRLRAHAIAAGQTASEVARAIIERRLTLDRDDIEGGPGRSPQ
ncbi:GAF domain-containing protein [Alloalcanivorax gelatiniphagus]